MKRSEIRLAGLGVLTIVQAITLGQPLPAPDPVGADSLPLLDVAQAAGLLYTEVDPAGQPTVDAAWEQAVLAGLDAYDLASDWRGLVDADGHPEFAYWLDLIDGLQAVGMQTYFGISTIDTNNLQLPPQFVDPNDERALAPGVNFDSPELIEQFGQLLDAIVPELVDRGVFFIAVGNEVDAWLLEHPDQIGPYAAFVQAARRRVHAIEPWMGVGACLSSEVVEHPEVSTPILGVSDVAVFTYYPIGPNSFDVRDPSIIEAELDALLAVAGSKQVILQEIGYPSGWVKSGINSSVDKQREFVQRMFPALAARPQIRFWSYLHLGDWGPDLLAAFGDYYGFSTPEFLEFLGTLGLHWNDGTPKPAFAEFLDGLLHRQLHTDWTLLKERYPVP